ncbi:MAG: hypothetical protein KME13_18570 [Myxacorys californica WJT36-NPBG1]|jgi:hypothetical protein|nr:hypothetical protein [Myxacorys californica WJT36-NPBG1]
MTPKQFLQTFSKEKAKSHNKLKANSTGWAILACGVVVVACVSFAVHEKYESVRVTVDSPIATFEIELDKEGGEF